MSPVPVGRLLEKAGSLVLEVTYPSDEELDKKPELAIGVLLDAIWNRCFDITRSGKGAEPPDELFKFLFDWVYRGHPLAKKAGLELALQQDNLWDLNLALLRIKKKGRPTKSRQTAIKALFRKTYLGKSWAEVTTRLCQCGHSHDDKLTLIRCQDNLESAVRILKTELKKYDIAFPPARIKESKSAYQAREFSQSKAQDLRKIPTLEESRGALRVPSDYAIQHPAIAILLDGGLLPITNSDSDRDDASYALSQFNPWDLGWIPMWFPKLLGAEPIGSKEEYQRQRFNCFDKVFKRFAGSDWPLKGSLDSQRQVIARTLLEMYRAVMAEHWLKIDELEPLKS